MKHIKVTVVAAIAAVALSQAPAGAGRDSDSKMSRKGQAVSVAGEYSGGLMGTIALGSEMVVVPKNIVIIDHNGKRLERGTSVSGRLVRATGQIRDGKLVANFIAVGEPMSKQDYSETTLPNVEADPDRAR